MSKVYTNQKTGLSVVSGKVKTVSDDRKTITVGVQKFVRGEDGNGSYQSEDAVLVAPVPVEGIETGDFVTATGFKAGGGKINADTISHENNYIESEGFGVISGEVLFANKNDEIDRETNQPRLTQAGTPKKPHFDITISVGSGKDRVNHVVKVYNTQDQDNIGRYEKLFANFDRTDNPIYASIVTKVENTNSYMRETKDKQGRTWQNQYMSHMGINSLDANFMNGRTQQAAKDGRDGTGNPQSAAKAPAAHTQAPAVEAPQTQSGFNYNLDDLDDLDMAQ